MSSLKFICSMSRGRVLFGVLRKCWSVVVCLFGGGVNLVLVVVVVVEG